MSVTSVDKDLDALSLTLVAEFAAPIAREWELWSDPRKLERWWGPPTYPTTIVEYDMTPGGRANYYMTSPDGEKLGAGGSSPRSSRRKPSSSSTASLSRMESHQRTCR